MNMQKKTAQMEMRWSREGHLILQNQGGQEKLEELVRRKSKRRKSKQNRAEYKENETRGKKGDCSKAGYKGKKIEKRTAERSLWSESLG